MFYSMRYREAVVDAFPEVNFPSSWAKGNIFLFLLEVYFINIVYIHFLGRTREKEVWPIDKWRQFLIDLATSKGLNPHSPATWEIINKKHIEAAGGAKVNDLLQLYSEVFPEIPFRKEWIQGNIILA